MKIPKWQHELARYYKRGKLVSYFLNNAAKTCLYGLKVSENIEIGHFFQPRTFLHLSSNLHTSCLSVFNINLKLSSGFLWLKYLFSSLHFILRNYVLTQQDRKLLHNLIFSEVEHYVDVWLFNKNFCH